MFRSYQEMIRRTDPLKQREMVNQSFTCDTCNQGNWLTETDVELHRKEAHIAMIHEQLENHKDRFCTICMKLMPSHRELIAHIKNRHLMTSTTARRVEREIFICHHCNRIFFNKDLIRTHMLYSHMWKTKIRNTKRFSCPKCKKICNLKAMWFHLQCHDLPSISACDICLTNFPTVKDLEKHLKIHQPFYKCETCSYQTLKEVHFEAHLDQHAKVKYKTKSCDKLVQKVFRIRSDSKNYRYNIHHALKGLDLPCFLHICILCREICMNDYEMLHHVLRDHLHTNPRQRYSCVCGQEFFNRVLLKHHVFKGAGEHRDVNDPAPPPKTVDTATQVTDPLMDTEPPSMDSTPTLDPLNPAVNKSSSKEDLPPRKADSLTQAVDPLGLNEESLNPAADSLTPTADSLTPTADSLTPAADSQTPAADSQTPAADSLTPAADSLISETSEQPQYIVIEQIPNQPQQDELTYVFAVEDDAILTIDENDEQIIGI